MFAQTRKIIYDFRGALKPPVVASRQGVWCQKTTQTGGTPLVQSVSGGSMDLVCDATNEVQVASLYMGDILPFDIATIVRVEFIAKLTAAVNAAFSGIFGLASARNDTIASIAQRAVFGFSGSNAITIDGVDGTNSQTGKATGLSLVATYRRFAIDFVEAFTTQSPPSKSLSGQSNVIFKMSNDKGAMNRVAGATRFDLSAYTGNLQLIAQLQKTPAAAAATLSILEASIEYKLPAGA